MPHDVLCTQIGKIVPRELLKLEIQELHPKLPECESPGIKLTEWYFFKSPILF